MRAMQLSDIDLTDLDRFAHGFPHEVFSFLRQHAPVWFHPPTVHTPGGEGFWVVSSYEDIVAVAADGETFSSQSGGGRDGGGTLIEDLGLGFAAGVLLNMMDDPRHRHIRRLVTSSVSPRALAQMEEELRGRANQVVAAAVDKGSCDFVSEIAAELPLQLIALLLGLPQGDRHQLFAWANANLDYKDRDLGEQNERALAANAAMFAYGADLIEQKRRQPASDMLSAVVHGTIPAAEHGEESLTQMELQMFFSLLIAAGSETTRNSLAIGMKALIEHPEAWRDLRRDRSLLPAAVEEMLRWASSTPYNRRTATRDTTLHGQAIAAGDKVVLWWASANRDESVFAEPFRFDIRRDPNRHVAFGHGSHFCLGATLARMEMRLLLDCLLDHTTSIELAGPVEWTRSNKHTGVRQMPVVLHR